MSGYVEITGRTIGEKTHQELMIEDIVRATLESAASRIEKQSGSEVYERAWKRAAELVRSMKP